jgi:acetyl esterase/lipase
MESPATSLRLVLAAIIFGGCHLASAVAADVPVPTLGKPTGFVAPDWLQHERPGLVKALAGVTVYKDIEYVPGASQQPLADPELMAPEALAYIRAGGKTRAFDLFFPAGLAPKMPVVVWFHGSPATGKKEDWCPAYSLLTHGYILVSANYRLSGEAPFPAQIYDDKAVIRWLRAHAAEYHIDPDHIGIWGHSAGGLQVTLVGATNDAPSLEGDEGNLDFSSHVQAACVWSG